MLTPRPVELLYSSPHTSLSSSEVNFVPYPPIWLVFTMLVLKQGCFVPKKIPAHIGSFRPYRRRYWILASKYILDLGKKVFLSHSHLPPATISTFSTSSQCHGLILAVATTFSSSSPLSLSV